MTEIIIEKFIDKKDEGKYIKLPVEVGECINKLTIEYNYARFKNVKDSNTKSKEEINIIDFGLYSPKDFLGASGSNRNTIQISDKSDEGFDNTEIIPGTWYILIGAYKIQDEGVQVQYKITLEEKRLELLKGDTHLHTNASDGEYSYNEVVKMADQQNLDYIVLADHNNYTQNRLITGNEPITVLPGTEWTHYKGHSNIVGIEKGIDDPFIHNDIEAVGNLFDKVNSKGGIISINHPFCNHCPWEWGMNDLNYDCVEVWNGGLLPEANKKALEWWSQQLDDGNQISIIGGSDFHKVDFNRNLGNPVTCVWTYGKSRKDILEAIKCGHSYVSYSVRGPSILIQADDSIQGSTVNDRKVMIILGDLKAGQIVHLMSGYDREEISIDNNYEEYIIEREMKNAKYIRVEIYSFLSEYLKMPISLSNPLYFE